MANKNNALFNAALVGFMEGAISGSWPLSSTAADYLSLKNAAVAFATEVDSLLAFDAQITTSNVDPTMLVDTGSQTIQSNTQFKPSMLRGVCAAVMSGRYTQDATAADYAAIAATVKAIYTEMLLGLVSP
jgi:hypothetical protein